MPPKEQISIVNAPAQDVADPPKLPDCGIVIACCDQDYLFAKGCCASVRYFLGDIPICLIIDGNFSIAELERTYGVKAIHPKDIVDQRLRRRSLGFGLTKMISFWESPWDRFLFMDADTIVWGDVTASITDMKDVLIDRYQGGHSDHEVNEYFFDTLAIEEIVSDFQWRQHQDAYFCSGVFAARKGALDINEYLHFLDIKDSNPEVLKLGDQGLLNAMIFMASDAGRIDLRIEQIQLVTSGYDEPGLRMRLPMIHGRPDTSEGAAVVHWAGPKPLMNKTALYPRPMTFFRRKFLSDAHGITGWRANLVLYAEDLMHHVLIFKNRARRQWRRHVLDRLSRNA